MKETTRIHLENALHSLNLDRNDIKDLPAGATVCSDITTLRSVGQLLEKVKREDTGENKVLIWSNEHKSWWRANSQGYDTNLAGAGLYDLSEAEGIVAGCSGRNEEIVTLAQAFTTLQQQAKEADKALCAVWNHIDKIEPILSATKVLERT